MKACMKVWTHAISRSYARRKDTNGAGPEEAHRKCVLQRGVVARRCVSNRGMPWGGAASPLHGHLHSPCKGEGKRKKKNIPASVRSSLRIT